MANANPSRPGVNPSAGRMEINVPTKTQVVRLKDGRIVLRTTMNTGTITESNVFPGDYENKIDLDESAPPAPKRKAKESD